MRLVAALLVAALAPLLALQALANNGVALPPADNWNGFRTASAAIARLEAEEEVAAGEVPDFVIRDPGPELARRAFAAEPLAADALFVLAVDARQEEGEAAARELAALATRLERRNRFMGVLRMQEAVAEGDYERAFAVLDEMTLVSPAMAPALVTALAPAVAEEDMRETIATTLEREPAWAKDFWTYSALNPDAIEGLIDLRNRVDAGITPEGDEALLRAAIIRGRFADAMEMWQRMAGASRNAIGYLPGEEYAPVGWLFDKTARKSVNVTGSGDYSLYVEANTNGAVGRQLVRLRPGTYTMAVEGDETVLAYLQGALECADATRLPVWYDLREKTNFVAGNQCEIYWLYLGADTFDDREPVRGKLTSIDFRRAR